MMYKSSIIAEAIVIFALFCFILIIYNEYNMKYKYTVDVPCYDKYNSLIHNTTYSYDVYCGPWQKSIPFQRGSLLCHDVNDNEEYRIIKPGYPDMNAGESEVHEDVNVGELIIKTNFMGYEDIVEYRGVKFNAGIGDTVCVNDYCAYIGRKPRDVNVGEGKDGKK